MRRTAQLNIAAEPPARTRRGKYFHFRRVTIETATRAAGAGTVLRAANVCNIPQSYCYQLKSAILQKIFKLHKLKPKYHSRDIPEDSYSDPARISPIKLFQDAVRECNRHDFQATSTL